MAAGSYAINPVNQEAVPIWVADYVLGSYGSGAIMAVPAHDSRDFEFAQQFGLPVRQVVQAPESSQDLPFIGQPSNCPVTACLEMRHSWQLSSAQAAQSVHSRSWWPLKANCFCATGFPSLVVSITSHQGRVQCYSARANGIQEGYELNSSRLTFR